MRVLFCLEGPGYDIYCVQSVQSARLSAGGRLSEYGINLVQPVLGAAFILFSRSGVRRLLEGGAYLRLYGIHECQLIQICKMIALKLDSITNNGTVLIST